MIKLLRFSKVLMEINLFSAVIFILNYGIIFVGTNLTV